MFAFAKRRGKQPCGESTGCGGEGGQVSSAAHPLICGALSAHPSTPLRVCAVINVAFTAHYNAPRYYFELRDRTLRRYLVVTASALGASLLIYLTVAFCGYLAFGDATKGDVLENFSPSYALAVGARIALVLVLLSVYPKVRAT